MIETKTNFNQLQASVEATRVRSRELRAASLAIQQCLSVTRRELAEVCEHTQATLEAVRQHLTSLRTGSAKQNKLEPEPANALLLALAILGHDKCGLEEMTDDLIEAFKNAGAVGDDDGRTLFADALMLIGPTSCHPGRPQGGRRYHELGLARCGDGKGT